MSKEIIEYRMTPRVFWALALGVFCSGGIFGFLVYALIYGAVIK